MLPLFSNNTFLSSQINPVNLLQAYNQAANMRALSSMLMASQEQALKNQIFTMMQMKNQFMQVALKNQQLQQTKVEESLSTASNSSFSPVPVESIQTPEKTRPESPVIEQAAKSKAEIDNFGLVKAQLEEMIYFLLNNIGKIDQSGIEKARKKYGQNLYLLPIFDSLVAKYCPVKKHREDIVRYVVRRAFKFLKNDIIQKEKVYGKRAYAALCKKYFCFSEEELQKTGVNTEDEKELIEFLLPYRKNSKNRTMNNNFTSEIFASKGFAEDYQLFLNNFETVLVEDNNKKIEKLIALAEECILKNCPEKIKKCTRLPWLQSWVEKTREVAFDLPKSGLRDQETLETTDKKLKTNNPIVKEEVHF